MLDLFHKEDGGEIDFSDEVNISEEFIQKVEAEMIREVIQLLNEKYKTVLVLYYYEQYSYKEMSEILNIPIGTVKYRLNYAKKQMREHLEGSFMKEDKFNQKIKSSLAREMIPSEELINHTKQSVRNARKLEKRWMIGIHAIWIVLLTVVIEQFVTHLDNKIPIIIAVVIMMHAYIPIYVVIQSFLKKEYKLHERVR